MIAIPRGVYERTEEHKRNLSLSHMGKRNHFKGKKHSLESRAKMSEGVRKAVEEGRWISWNKGKKLSAEIREHMSDAKRLWYKIHSSPIKGRTIDRTIVEKRRESTLLYYEDNNVWNLGKKHSKVTRKKISDGMRRYWNERKKKVGKESNGQE